jgi:SAM domain (Sterile alpha motif)
MDVVVWLRSLGLGKYEAVFRENDIDETVLPSLTHENLKELGVEGQNWRGKVFFPSNNKSVSEGRNRIREFLALPRSPIVPMARFDTMLVDSDPLAPDARSNVVVLNYAHPQTRPYWLELVLSKVQVYDVQVAVLGKYGPIFLGKTWLGNYDKDGQFTAFDPGQLIARYFLDFNDGAIKEQREEHWDGSDEEFVDPLIHVEN